MKRMSAGKRTKQKEERDKEKKRVRSRSLMLPQGMKNIQVIYKVGQIG